MKANNISNLAPKRTFLQKVKDIWNEEKPTDQEIIVSKMMAVLFESQSTEQIIDTLILFEEKAKARLEGIKQQAETDRFVTEFYLGTNQSKKVSV
jgi:hypothetical protein